MLKNTSGIFVQEQIYLINNLFENGNTSASSLAIKSLATVLNQKNLEKLHPYTFGNFNLIFGKIQMQFGSTFGEHGSLLLTKKGAEIFSDIGEHELYIRALNLEGHILRQLKKHKEAVERFQYAEQVADAVYLTPKVRENLKMNLRHQIAITLARVIEKKSDESTFREAQNYLGKVTPIFCMRIMNLGANLLKSEKLNFM